MSINIVRREAERLRDAFLKDGCDLVEINMGLCSDFAEALERGLSEHGINIANTGLDYFWAMNGGVDAEAQSRRDRFAPPPGLDWATLEDLGFPDAAPHTWIEFGDLCFDAEMTTGTKTPFNLPCIRHALIELLEADPSRLAALVETHEWWRESVNIRQHRDILVDAVIARSRSSLKL